MTRSRRARAGQDAAPPDLELLLIDGDNLLHRVRGTRDPAAERWLLPTLRAWLPSGVSVVVMLDGHPGPGFGMRRRAAPGIDFQHSGSQDADTAIVGTLRARPYADRIRTLVVTDDRSLTERARYAGGLTRRLDWLIAQLGRPTDQARPTDPAGPTALARSNPRPLATLGAGRPPRTSGPVEPSDEPEREPWHPGRGATRKRGNPRREPRLR